MMIFLKNNARLVIVAVAVVVFCGMLSAMFSSDTVIQTGSWGLSFQEEGKAPKGNAGAVALSRYDAAYCKQTDEKVLYLTFDAGYDNGCTAQILDTLNARHVPAAFFVVGSFIKSNPELVQRMAKEGHIVGNHTEHHYDMSHIADEETFRNELESVEEEYLQAVGEPMPKFYRPPQGIYSEQNLKMAQELGYKTVFWSLAYVDWLQDDQPSSDEAFEKLLGRIHPGAVVLLHSTSSTNAAILDELLDKWEQMGYRFGTLEELFSEDTNHFDRAA